MSFGLDSEEMFRQPVNYITRILHGDRPGDMSVQAPTRFRLAINVTTAKSLGLTVPPTLYAMADDVFQ